jgi:hypothetical protein
VTAEINSNCKNKTCGKAGEQEKFKENLSQLERT